MAPTLNGKTLQKTSGPVHAIKHTPEEFEISALLLRLALLPTLIRHENRTFRKRFEH